MSESSDQPTPSHEPDPEGSYLRPDDLPAFQVDPSTTGRNGHQPTRRDGEEATVWTSAGWPGPAAPWSPPETPPKRRRPPTPPPSAPRASLVRELLLVGALAFGPEILTGLLLLAQGGSTSVSRQPGLIDNAVGLVLSTMIAWLPVVAIALVLRHRGEGAATIGLGRFEPGRDTGAGLLLWIAGFLLVAYVLAPLFRFLGEHPPDLLPSSLPLWFRITEALAIGATAGITEEVVVRGYAQTRLEQLRLPTVLVVLLPTLLWGSLHLYEGLGGAITVFFLGLGYAIWFQRTRRLWPIVIAHGLFDLTSLALAIIYTKH